MVLTRTFIASSIAIAALSLLLVSWFSGANGAKVAERIQLRPDDPATVATGKRVYAEHCASCHGARLEGQANWRRRLANGRLPAPPHDASGHTWHHPDELLFRLTKYGPAALIGGDYQSDMPAYDDVLIDAEIIAVLSFIKSRWPEDIQRRHDRMSATRQ